MAEQWMCSECGHKRSISEIKCGNCGNPKPADPVVTEKKKPPMLLIVFTAVLVLLAVGTAVWYFAIKIPTPGSGEPRTVPRSAVTEKTTVGIWYIKVSIDGGDRLDLVKGDEKQFTAKVTPAEVADTPVTWKSDNEAVLSLTETGKAQAVSVGSAVVTATAGTQTAEITVTVKLPVPVERLSINDGSSATISVGNSQAFTVTVTPANATNANFEWKSSAPDIASVGQDGIVVAKKGGAATITVTAGGKSASIAVTVHIPVPVSSVSISSGTLGLVVGTSKNLSATISPNDSDVRTVNWSSSNSAVASVDSNGKVTAKSRGTAEITATAEGKSAKCIVTVTPPVAVDSVRIDQGNRLTMGRGTSRTLSATASPSNATSATVIWTSSNSSVASVDSNSGRVTANAKGTATITATAGGKTSTCTITVNVPVTSVSISQSSMTLYSGNTDYFYVTVYPSDADNKDFEAYGEPANIAGVLSKDTSSGKVTVRGSNSGSGKIVIRTKDGSFTQTCYVTVR